MLADAFYMAAPLGPGRRFCLFHPPVAEPRGIVLYVHPFAEEMNKARRMAALQVRALSQAGWGVLQIDLFGCGDSEGDFGEATWEHWIDDVVLACQWLRRRASAPLWLWGLRAGCLLAAAAACRLEEGCNFLFWQPVVKGRTMLQQFLRLRLAADLGSGERMSVERLREQLALGAAVDVAGYKLGASLAAGLERASLDSPGHSCRVEWFELSPRKDSQLGPASAACAAEWQAGGAALNVHLIEGPAFWQNVEIEEVPALIEATSSALDGRSTP